MPSSDQSLPLIIRHLGLQDYSTTFTAMKNLVDSRNKQSCDEIWFLEHRPVFTQGQAGKATHVLAPAEIPVVKTDRGGQVTYHGPGQITAYLMIDLKRLNIGVRDLVSLMEQAIVDCLLHWDIEARPRSDAPGVYTLEGQKIASLGLRIRKGSSYHGVNFNIDMDMEPWKRINPCGLGVEMTQMADLIQAPPSKQVVVDKLAELLQQALGYNSYQLGDNSILAVH
jgi:lipoyl(octanoyl) transferase